MQTALENIRNEIGRLVIQDPFLATIALSQKIVITQDPKMTAGVNGVEMIFNEDFWNKLTRQQKRTLLAHELFHLANQHDLRKGTRDHVTWNRACDYAINHHLVGPGYEFPEGGCTDAGELKRFAGKAAEDVYSTLAAEAQDEDDEPDNQGEEPKGGQDAPGGDGQGGDGTDDQDDDQATPQGGQDATDGGDDPQDGQGQGEPSQGSPGGGQGDDDPQEWGEVMPNPEADNPDVIEERRQLIQEAISAGKQAGTIPANFEREFKDSLRQPADWRAILANNIEDFVKNDWSWRKPDPRFTGVIMPSLRSDAFANITIAVDTSASMDEEAVSAAIKEVFTAVRAYDENGQDAEITIMFVDTEVNDTQVITSEHDLALPSGGGGTRFQPAFDHACEMDEPPKCLVYITDGDASTHIDEPPFDTIWMLTERNDGFNPPFGEVIQMEGNA